MLYPAFYLDALEYDSEFIEQLVDYEELSFSTQLNGGYSDCTLRVSGPSDLAYERYRVLLGTHMVLWDSWGDRIYEGRVQEINMIESGVEMTLYGYYAHANEVLHGLLYYPDVDPVPVTDVIDDCIGLTYQIRSSQRTWQEKYAFTLRDANVDVTALGVKDYTQAKIGEVIEEVTKLGYKETDGTPVYFAIWQNRIPYFWKELDPTQTSNLKSLRFWIIESQNVVEPRKTRSRDQVFNKVWGVYESAIGSVLTTSSAENKISQARFGLREGTVNVGQTEEGVANSLRDAALERHSWPRQGYSMRIQGYIRHYSGMKQPVYWVKAGDIIMLGYEDPANADLDDPLCESTSSITGMIMSTNYNSGDGTLQIEINSNDTRFDILLARLGLGGSIS